MVINPQEMKRENLSRPLRNDKNKAIVQKKKANEIKNFIGLIHRLIPKISVGSNRETTARIKNAASAVNPAIKSGRCSLNNLAIICASFSQKKAENVIKQEADRTEQECQD